MPIVSIVPFVYYGPRAAAPAAAVRRDRSFIYAMSDERAHSARERSVCVRPFAGVLLLFGKGRGHRCGLRREFRCGRRRACRRSDRLRFRFGFRVRH
jgi:hypothetical protein